jgi:hypothetical protein
MSTDTVPPDTRLFVWSKEAREAFLSAAAKGNGRFNVAAGLDAALRLDGPVLAATILEKMIPHLASLNRTLVLKPGADGTVVLKVDEDLIRFVIQNHVPAEADARILETAEQELTDDLRT